MATFLLDFSKPVEPFRTADPGDHREGNHPRNFDDLVERSHAEMLTLVDRALQAPVCSIVQPTHWVATVCDRVHRAEFAGHRLPTSLSSPNQPLFVAMVARCARQLLTAAVRRRRFDARLQGSSNVLVMSDLGDRWMAHDVMTLDEELNRLAQIDRDAAQVLELRFYGGMSIDDTACALTLAPDVVARKWRSATSWLALELSTDVSATLALPRQRRMAIH